MRRYLSMGLTATLLAVAGLFPAMAQAAENFFGRPWVDYQNGEISVAFYQARLDAAVDAIQARTGLRIDLPPATKSRLLDLRLSRVELEPAVRTLLASIGVKNFALMYDEKGRPSRAVVLEASLVETGAAPAAEAAAPDADPAARPLSAEERDHLKKELERWSELTQAERGRIEDRLKSLPASEERERLVKEYGRQVLGIKN